MRPDQPHNMAIAEFVHQGAVGRVTASAATKDDDAIRMIVDRLAQNGIAGSQVTRLYSERQPSPDWCLWFAEHWPHVAVTWSFAEGEGAKMEAAIDKLLTRPEKPWWKVW